MFSYFIYIVASRARTYNNNNMIKAYYWYNSSVSDPIRSNRPWGFRQHVSNRSNTAASNENAPPPASFGGVTPALKKCGVALLNDIFSRFGGWKRPERKSRSRSSAWCGVRRQTKPARQKRVVVKYTKKRLLKKKMLSRIPFGETKTGTYLLRAPSLSVLELFPGHVLQLNRRHHREYCTSSSTPSARRRRRRRVRRRPVVVFEDILKVVCKAGRNACGRIIRRRQRVALRRRTLRDDPVEVVTRCQSGCRQRGGGREEDHRSGLSFKAGSLKASARFLSTTRGGFASLFFLPFFLFFCV